MKALLSTIGVLVMVVSVIASGVSALGSLDAATIPLLKSNPTSASSWERAPASAGGFDWASALPRATGHPFAHAPPGVWMPLVAQMGREEAARIVADDDPYGPDEFFGGLEVVPLGDANGDHRGDFLLATPKSGGGEQLVAIAGGTYTTLWSKEVAPKAYWYPQGDVDGDGVVDLTLEKPGKTTVEDQSVPTPVSHVGRFVVTTPVVIEFVSGSTGKTLFEKSTEDRYESTSGSLMAPPPVDAYLSARLRFSSSPHAWEVSDPKQPGIDILTFQDTGFGSSFWGQNNYLFGAAYVDRVHVERLDPSGKTRWSATIDHAPLSVALSDRSDYTGDGISDYLVSVGTTDAWTFNSVQDVYPPPVSVLQVELLNGATGKVDWTWTSDPYSEFYGFALPTGKAVGPGFGVAAIQLGSEVGPTLGQYGARITYLNGATGDELSSQRMENQFMAVARFADANGDGKEDLFFVRQGVQGTILDYPNFSDKVEFGVLQGDGNKIWSIETNEENAEIPFEFIFYGDVLPDFDGDNVPDFFMYIEQDDSSAVEFHSGATGEAGWILARDDHSMVEFVPDVTGDKGWDLAFSVVEGVDDESAHAHHPGPPPLGTASPEQALQPGPTTTATASPSRSKAPESSKEQPPHPAVSIELRSGRDAQLVWRSVLQEAGETPPHDPASNATPPSYLWSHPSITGIMDVNGNGVDDLIVIAMSGRCVRYGDLMACEYPVPMDEDADHEVPLPLPPEGSQGMGWILEGADGSTLYTIPAGPAVSGGGAGQDVSFLPAPGVALVLLVVLAFVGVRRRRMDSR